MLRKLGRGVVYVYIALALAPLVVFALYFPAYQIWRLIDERDWYTRDAVTSPERAAELAKQGLIEQIVTFERPIALRKESQSDHYDLYAIAVSQTTLPEEITPTTMFRQEPFPGISEGPRRGPVYASSNPIIGQFNNVILYEPKTGKLTPVFSTRLALSEFRFTSGPDVEVLLVLAAERDTDKDGKLSGRDELDLYAFSVGDATLHKVDGLSGNPVEIVDLPGEPFVVVRSEIDNPPPAADHPEVPKPVRLYRVDLRTYKAEAVVPGDMLDRLQRTLDGRSLIEGPAK